MGNKGYLKLYVVLASIYLIALDFIYSFCGTFILLEHLARFARPIVILTNIEMSTQQPIVSMKFLEYK
jgi:hypothetical protein